MGITDQPTVLRQSTNPVDPNSLVEVIDMETSAEDQDEEEYITTYSHQRPMINHVQPDSCMSNVLPPTSSSLAFTTPINNVGTARNRTPHLSSISDPYTSQISI
ncbi:hypothetical protein DPMN_127088 [Dreissena polymorpha]|uniref:Uncharacterized protein n=1 Tax=Dreissena polymorpha TaxID=45954 RepID=A0A9D4JW76_DREPO|nr:hypothetical protein DPMN_127088 [Dreissena polymorpha]